MGGVQWKGVCQSQERGRAVPPHPAMIPYLDAKSLGEGQDLFKVPLMERPEQELDL